MSAADLAPALAAPAVKTRVLLVDDEEQLLRALALQLRRDHEVHVCTSGTAALELLGAGAPFPVVVSDMRMPGMNGADFLAVVRRRWPDTVRILLTGQADLESAARAVNEGQIFRFLSKPMPADQLRATLADAVRQHALVTAERDLLENTLRRSIGVLADVLSLVNPEAFSCSARVAEVVDALCAHLQLADRWQVQVAALLSQLGCVTLTPDTARKAYAGQPLSAEEQVGFAGHPKVAGDLIGSIPRLDGVAAIVRSQEEPPRFSIKDDLAAAAPAEVAAEVLRVALRFDRLVRRSGRVAAIAALRQGGATHPRMIEALVAFRPSWEGERTASVRFAELRVGMVLRTDLVATSGLLLAAAGTIVHATLLLRLANFANSVGLREPIEVLVPGDAQPGTRVVSPPELNMDRPKVLLVDDEPALLRGLSNALRREPFCVLTAPSGAAALEVMAAQAPQAVVSDQDMPGMTGAELLGAIARRHPETMRMMLTGRGDLSVAMRAINEGEVFRFFTKPLAATELAAAIREALAILAAAPPTPEPLVERRSVARLAALEESVPGITRLDTSGTGAIVVRATDEDVAALVARAVEQLPAPKGGARAGSTGRTTEAGR